MTKPYSEMARAIVNNYRQMNECLLTNVEFLEGRITKALEQVAKERDEEIAELKELLKHKGYLDEVWKRNQEIKSLSLRLERMREELKKIDKIVRGGVIDGKALSEVMKITREAIALEGDLDEA